MSPIRGSPPNLSSPPFRGEREGPIAKRWEGEVGVATALASPTSPQPSPPPGAERELVDLVLDPHPGARLPLDVELVDEDGGAVSLASFFTGKPVVLVLDYLRCNTICGVALANLAEALGQLPLVAGRDYTVLAVSIDPRDTPADAALAKAKYLARYPSETAAGWHFLTGAERAVRPTADAVGFRYRYDPASDQYIHSVGFVILAPDATVSAYLTELDVTPTALKAALAAAAGKVPQQSAGPLDRLRLLCFGRAGPSGRFTALVETALVLLNLAGMMAAIGLFAWVRRRRHQ